MNERRMIELSEQLAAVDADEKKIGNLIGVATLDGDETEVARLQTQLNDIGTKRVHLKSAISVGEVRLKAARAEAKLNEVRHKNDQLAKLSLDFKGRCEAIQIASVKFAKMVDELSDISVKINMLSDKTCVETRSLRVLAAATMVSSLNLPISDLESIAVASRGAGLPLRYHDIQVKARIPLPNTEENDDESACA